jgi:hypothetical protein
MRIVPYVEINGSRTLSDDYMRGLYRRMVEENTAKIISPSGKVKDEGGFVDWAKNPKNAIMLIVDGETPLMLSWVTGIEDHRGWFSFCGFKSGWGRKKSIALGQACRDYWLNMQDSNGRHVFDVLVGITPAANRLALIWAKMCGAQTIGTIPCFGTNHYTGKRYDVAISYITR